MFLPPPVCPPVDVFALPPHPLGRPLDRPGPVPDGDCVPPRRFLARAVTPPCPPPPPGTRAGSSTSPPPSRHLRPLSLAHALHASAAAARPPEADSPPPPRDTPPPPLLTNRRPIHPLRRATRRRRRPYSGQITEQLRSRPPPAGFRPNLALSAIGEYTPKFPSFSSPFSPPLWHPNPALPPASWPSPPSARAPLLRLHDDLIRLEALVVGSASAHGVLQRWKLGRSVMG